MKSAGGAVCGNQSYTESAIAFSDYYCDRCWGGVHLYISVYVLVGDSISLNGTLAINSPFQTLVVDFLSNL